MTPELPRTDATSRERSPDHQYTLSIEQTAELYAQAGLPRTARAIQKYCAVSKLDCHKAETETGEKYLVAPYSVDRHIAYINEVRTVANNRDRTRTDASVRPLQNKDEPGSEQARTAAKSPEQSRTDATSRERTRTFAPWKITPNRPANSREQRRTVANSRERTRPFAAPTTAISSASKARTNFSAARSASRTAR